MTRQEHKHPDALPSADPVLQSEGISVLRRALLWLPIAALGTGAACARRTKQPEAPGPAGDDGTGAPLTGLSLDELGRRWQRLAAELLDASSAEDESYAAQLTGLIARVPGDALPRRAGSQAIGEVSGGPCWFAQPGLAIEFRMEPGAELRLHNHPPQVVVTQCVEGEVDYRHLEIVGDAPPCTTIDGREFLVRETRSGILAPRCSTSLTRVRDGMHGFIAGRAGARLLDFTLSLTEDIDTFSYVQVSPQPEDRTRRIYRAVWLGKS